MDDKLCFVQFIHPGGEHKPDYGLYKGRCPVSKILFSPRTLINLPHDPLRPLRGGDDGLASRAWLRVERIVGGLQVTHHEDSCQFASTCLRM
jgi:hypothetical protein